MSLSLAKEYDVLWVSEVQEVVWALGSESVGRSWNETWKRWIGDVGNERMGWKSQASGWVIVECKQQEVEFWKFNKACLSPKR